MKWSAYAAVASLGAGLGMMAGALFGGRVARLVRTTEWELRRWQGGLRESDPLGIQYVRTYWTEGAGQPYPGVATPWSAAFISYVTNKANPGSLPRSGSHMLYAGRAKAGEGDFRVIPAAGQRVRPGDLILRTRAGTTIAFEDIGHGHVDSHVDVVTRVSGGVARAIGGNKNNAVAVEDYPLKPDGSLADPRAVALLRMS